MAHTFLLEILSPTRVFFTGSAIQIVFPAIDGLHGVLYGHEAMVTALESGTMKYQTEDGVWHTAAVSGGMVEIMPDYVILLSDTVERPEEIDVMRAQRARERAAERLRQTKSTAEYYQSQAALMRAIARLKTGTPKEMD